MSPSKRISLQLDLSIPKTRKGTIALDTETTGLFIHKGCRAFMLCVCTDLADIVTWTFKVNPSTRKPLYSQQSLQEFVNLVKQFDTVVFHNANFDLQVLAACGIHWDWFFDNFDIHDSMVMSHAYKSDNRHGLKDNAILLMEYPDTDEHILTAATKEARTIARKLGWRIAEKDDLHESIEGTQKEHFRCDYWVPKQIAEYLQYPLSHPWHSIGQLYGGKDTERTLGIFYIFEDLLKQERQPSAYSAYNYLKTDSLYDKYEEARQHIRPILNMQTIGIPIRERALFEAKDLFLSRQADSLAELERLSGIPNFNPRSQKQLPTALFQKLGFEPVKFGKSGAPSTDKEVISKLFSKAEIVNNQVPAKYKFLVALQEYRKETTTLQYITNYEKHSRPTHGNADYLIKDKSYAVHRTERVIRPVFSQTRTGTGRLSCTDPNTTNVGKKDMSNPFADAKGADKLRASLFSEILGIDTDHRFTLRNVFGPRPGELWTCIDYDQFQLRIFAIVSESYELIEGFERGEDIHMLVARIIFNKQDISDVERTAAKAINFGLLFGAGAEKIELLAGIPGLYRLFMSNFPKAKYYLDAQSRLARQYGYVHTVGGYRLYVPHNAPHAASCYVIQGTEAEIVKHAMVGVDNFARQSELASLSQHYTLTRLLKPSSTYTLLMMIHDELVFTSKEHDYEELTIIMTIMENSGRLLGIPCKVDAKIATNNWADRTSLKLERTNP